MKEAISAVEPALSIINGERSKNMTEALSVSERKGIVFHPALKAGILRIYGWTSDEEGIRHAAFSDDNRIDDQVAKLMLVLCSALLNYLVVISKQTSS